MIERLLPIQFDRRATTGRTAPGFIVGEDIHGSEVEVVAKISAQCDRGVTSLAMELVSACLAGDLGLPIPQPYFVVVDPDWVASIGDVTWQTAAARSSPLAFGSRRVPPGFGTWIAGSSMVGSLTSTAAAVLLFDCLIDNTDRRAANPNCLQRGDELRIIDHELCFPAHLLGWRPPWTPGALQHLVTQGAHIFRDALRRREVDWSPAAAAWRVLSDGQLADYGAAIPAEWNAATAAVNGAIEKIRNARDNIDGCVAEVQRVLTC